MSCDQQQTPLQEQGEQIMICSSHLHAMHLVAGVSEASRPVVISMCNSPILQTVPAVDNCQKC